MPSATARAGKTTSAPTVTLADVAAHLGVSRTTVSNAYNRPDQLSPALRDKVLAAATDLGYCGPDPVARGLRRGQTGSFGLVFDQPLTYAFTDPAAALFLQGMAAGLEEHGAALAIIPRMPEGPERSAELVRSALVDGYMLFCTSADDPRLGAVRARGLPYVLVERPTAILAISDVLALGVLQAAAERGIDVPGELSVVGFDDIPQAATATPALTTVFQPHEEKGRAAVRLLVSGADPADSVLLPCRLVVRASTGPAPH